MKPLIPVLSGVTVMWEVVTPKKVLDSADLVSSVGQPGQPAPLPQEGRGSEANTRGEDSQMQDRTHSPTARASPLHGPGPGPSFHALRVDSQGTPCVALGCQMGILRPTESENETQGRHLLTLTSARPACALTPARQGASPLPRQPHSPWTALVPAGASIYPIGLSRGSWLGPGVAEPVLAPAFQHPHGRTGRHRAPETSVLRTPSLAPFLLNGSESFWSVGHLGNLMKARALDPKQCTLPCRHHMHKGTSSFAQFQRSQTS